MMLDADGVDVLRALGALWHGAFGSWYAFFSATLLRATPLLFLGLAVSLAFRAGVLNIGADGQFLAGAVASTAVALASTGIPAGIAIPAMLAAGMLGGTLWSGVAAFLRWKFGVLEVISTLLLNFVASSLVAWLVRGPLQEPTRAFPQTSTFPSSAQWPFLFRGQRLHLGFALALAAAIGLWWIVARTATGLRVRAVGAGRAAAASAGMIGVERTTVGAFLASGALAGAAGASEVGGVTHSLYENISPGYGYTAIAVALVARLDPRYVIVSAVFFGALQAGAAEMQRSAGVPAPTVSVVVAVIILGILAARHFGRGLPGVPSAEGEL